MGTVRFGRAILTSTLLILTLIALAGKSCCLVFAPENYLWKTTVDGTKVLTLQIVPDSNSDGHEDILVVSNSTDNGALFLIDGKKGDIIRENATLGILPLEVLFIKQPTPRIVIAYHGGVKVYNLLLQEMITFPMEEDYSVPRNMGTFSGNEVCFTYGKWGYYYVECHSLMTKSKLWAFRFWGDRASAIYQLLFLNPNKVLILDRFWGWWHTYRWNIYVYDNNGTRISTLDYFLNADYYSDTLFLTSYNSTFFLCTHQESSSRFIKLVTIDGASEVVVWGTEVWNANGNDGLVVVDINQDGVKEVAAIIGGNAALLSGSDGNLIYNLPEIFGDNIAHVAFVNDVNNDGIEEVLVYTDKLYLVSLGASTYQILWEHSSGSEGIVTIEDVDEDENRDVVAASGSGIYCFGKSVIPEFPSLIFLPLFMTLTLLAAVAYRRKRTLKA